MRGPRKTILAAVAVLAAGGGIWAAERSGTPAPSPKRATPVARVPAPSTPSAGPVGFPASDCERARTADGSVLGLAVPRPARLRTPGPEQTAFNAATTCLTSIAGQPPALRTQLPIDVLRRTTPGADERAELTAFGALIAERKVAGVVSVRAHDFSDCTGATARERGALAPDEPLRPCEYPTPALYAQLFGELHAAVTAAAGPGADLRFTAWNEPDHPDFTLHALGERGAARKAGEYWAQAAAIAGAERVLAGEFADRELPVLLRLRDAFLEGTGGAAPPAWALHPYRDLTAAPDAHVVDGFEQAVAPASVWLTEVTARLSGRAGLSGDAAGQAARGAGLRARLQTKATRAFLYLLLPPTPPATPEQDGWDSALADRQGRARPFVCGLAELPTTHCPGDPAAFGG